MTPRHLLIAGTGRAGTTVLMQLLEACGLNTGAENLTYSGAVRAGLERTFDPEHSPYVVKHPYLSDDLAGLIDNGFDPALVDAVIVPMRSLDDAAASRIQVFSERGLLSPGSLWRKRRPGRQRCALAESLHGLLVTTSTNGIPVALVAYPRFVHDAAYAWKYLEPVLPTVERETFLASHADILRPEMVSVLHYPDRFQMALLDAKWVLQSGRLWAGRTLSRRRGGGRTASHH